MRPLEPVVGAEWPAGQDAMQAGARFLRGLTPGSRVVVACDRDVDGLSAGSLFTRALRRLGHAPDRLVARRGEHPHEAGLRERIRRAAADALVVVDMGSRSGAIVAGLPTLVVDHHQPSGVPDGAILVSAYGHPPIASSSVLAFHLLAQVAPVDDLDWLALLGAHADLAGDLPGLAEVLARHRRSHVSEAVALLNAARRAPSPEVDVAADALDAASSPADVALGRVPGIDHLRAARAEVNAEVARCARTPPVFAGEVALLRVNSRAQVHPLLATRWARRLRDRIVMVANDGFVADRIHFAMRTQRDVDLIAFLRSLRIEDMGTEFANGHAAATGGSVTPAQFERLLRRLGFPAPDERAASSRVDDAGPHPGTAH